MEARPAEQSLPELIEKLQKNMLGDYTAKEKEILRREAIHAEGISAHCPGAHMFF
jgi:hypothetical protein